MKQFMLAYEAVASVIDVIVLTISSLLLIQLKEILGIILASFTICYTAWKWYRDYQHFKREKNGKDHKITGDS